MFREPQRAFFEREGHHGIYLCCKRVTEVQPPKSAPAHRKIAYLSKIEDPDDGLDGKAEWAKVKSSNGGTEINLEFIAGSEIKDLEVQLIKSMKNTW